MGRRVVLVAAAGVALLLYASTPAKFFVPLGPNVAAPVAQRVATAAQGVWTPRSDPYTPAKMTLMDKESVDELAKGMFGRPGSGFEEKGDPYNTDAMKEKLKQQQKMFDNLLALKEKLEAELPFMFGEEELDASHFEPDVVFKEPHLPPIRGRQNYQLFLHGLRDTGHLIFEEPRFHVVRATVHEKDGLVKVRWKISGKYKSPFKFFQSESGCFDGISYYNVAGSSGLVSVHQVDYHIPILPPVLQNQDALSWLDKAFAGVPSVPACSSSSYSES